MAVTVEVPERHIATAPAPAPAPARETHRSGHLPERAVQVIAIGTGSGRRRQQEVEITVVVEVHEQRPGGGRRVGQAGRRRDVPKLAAARIAKQGPPPAAGRDVQVDPSIVVVIAERGRGGAIAQHDPRARRGFDEPPLVTAKQMTRDEQVLGLIIVVIAHREGHGALERTGHAVGERLHALEPATGCDISEPDLRGHRPSVLGGNR